LLALIGATRSRRSGHQTPVAEARYRQYRTAAKLGLSLAPLLPMMVMRRLGAALGAGGTLAGAVTILASGLALPPVEAADPAPALANALPAAPAMAPAAAPVTAPVAAAMPTIATTAAPVAEVAGGTGVGGGLSSARTMEVTRLLAGVISINSVVKCTSPRWIRCSVSILHEHHHNVRYYTREKVLGRRRKCTINPHIYNSIINTTLAQPEIIKSHTCKWAPGADRNRPACCPESS
jgi:hypothetical protein